MTLTNSLGAIAQYIRGALFDNRNDIGLDVIFYGDQSKLDAASIACVEPDNKQVMLRQSAAARVVDLVFVVQIICYNTSVNQGIESNRTIVDTIAERVEAFLNLDPQLGGLITHGYCTGIESGYATKQNGLVRAARVTYEGRTSGFILPSS